MSAPIRARGPGGSAPSSWYLDPLVAAQKQAVHLELLSRWMKTRPALLLKTDLFEEANGADQLLFELSEQSEVALGLDVNAATAGRAKHRRPYRSRIFFAAADVRALPLRSGSVDLILSNSTLDHFDKKEDFERAIVELARILRADGCLIVTVDNVLNPLYWPLRWLSWAGPFRLGYSPSPRTLSRMVSQTGLTTIDSDQLIHNPRLVSTILFLGLRRLLGKHADPAIRALLASFALLGSLPTRRFTGCFWAIAARKPTRPEPQRQGTK